MCPLFYRVLLANLVQVPTFLSGPPCKPSTCAYFATVSCQGQPYRWPLCSHTSDLLDICIWRCCQQMQEEWLDQAVPEGRELG